jgi:hypothetical protein
MRSSDGLWIWVVERRQESDFWRRCAAEPAATCITYRHLSRTVVVSLWSWTRARDEQNRQVIERTDIFHPQTYRSSLELGQVHIRERSADEKNRP